MNLLETTYLVLLESKHYCIFFMSVFNPVADSANDDPDHYTFIFLVADSGLRKVERGVGRTGCHVHRENNEVPSNPPPPRLNFKAEHNIIMS